MGVVFASKPVNVGDEVWPYPGYEREPRIREVLDALRKGCPDIEFVSYWSEDPEDRRRYEAEIKDVDGILLHVMTLHWEFKGSMAQMAGFGKPMIVSDEFLGGSGVFLTGLPALLDTGKVAAVSTTRLADLVTVARCFTKAKEVDQQAFAKMAMHEYRKTFATSGEMNTLDDPIDIPPISEVVDALRKKQFLVIGAGTKAIEVDVLGTKAIYRGFEELDAYYQEIDPEAVEEKADSWIARAEKVVEPERKPITEAARVALAIRKLLAKHDTDTITMNCLGGFNQGKLPAYPCLGFTDLLDEGGHGVCEAQPDDTLSMYIARLLTGRSGFVSDPVLDTSKNQIIYAHCMAPTKMLGTDTEGSRFKIRSLHNRDPRGACVQSFMPDGYMTTTFRTDYRRKTLILHRAKAVGNLDSERGCRSQLVGEVDGDIERLMRHWYAWHRVTVYGDIKEPLVELADALGLKVIEEA